MQRKLIAINGLLIIMLVSACTTTPYVRHRTPKINGEIIIDQQPASGIKVYLSTDGSDSLCLKALNQTETDSYGRFAFSSIRDHMTYTPLMTHYLDEWVICADIAGQRQQIYSGNRYGMGSVIESLDLRCEFGNASSGDGACRQRFEH
ncbi:MAG: hypothetical protein EP315_09300 [Gammaproteobacteria bacterium]|nr:MAG: hypothetical protein EP315_09300 [Gammaproteobacteria bacterium]